MSREIKFRAWVTNLCIPFMAVQGEPDLETLGSFFHHYCGSEQEKLMQFSGLRDKNGVEIYEGDIVKCGYGIENVVSCCKNCNSAKMELSTNDFKNHIIKIYEHFILR